MVRSSRLAHDGSTLLPDRMDPGVSRAPLATVRCARTGAVSSGPGTRSARGNAERRSARSRHSGVGCSHAPRPGSRRRGSGVSTPCTATTRNRPPAGDRVRHPTHIRIGAGRTGGAPWSWAGPECSAAARRAAPAPRDTDRATRISRRTPTRERRPRRGDRRRCGCRSASRSAGPRAARSAPPCRSRGRAGNRAPPPERCACGRRSP